MSTTDGAMDIDMDIDLVDDPEIARLQAEAAAFDNPTVAPQYEEAMNGVEEPPEEGEVDAHALVPKVHVRGVNDFKPDDVKRYYREHFSTDLFKKVEWIDDTSLNLVYDTELAAEEALQAFSAEDQGNPITLRPAKPLSTHPDVKLYVRHAVESDVKTKGAALYSRFYLDNPEYDPETRKRTYGQRGGRTDYRERDYSAKRVRRGYEDDRYSRRSSTNGAEFNEDMYDDKPRAAIDDKQRRTSDIDSYRPDSRRLEDHRRESHRLEGRPEDYRAGGYHSDLFAGKQNGRLRNRSASPVREGDGRYGFADDQPQRRTARARSPTPPGIRRDRANRAARDHARKELFPEKQTSSLAYDRPVELISKRDTASTAPKELFPNHRRQQAKDLGPDEVTEAIGSYHIYDGAYDTFTYGSSGRRPASNGLEAGPRNGSEGKDLFSRISGGPKVESSYGRLQDTSNDTEFSFKGAGKNAGSGFSFLGASKEKVAVKELFPALKAVGGKKDLFDGRIKGRGQRGRAEDMLY